MMSNNARITSEESKINEEELISNKSVQINDYMADESNVISKAGGLNNKASEKTLGFA